MSEFQCRKEKKRSNEAKSKKEELIGNYVEEVLPTMVTMWFKVIPLFNLRNFSFLFITSN